MLIVGRDTYVEGHGRMLVKLPNLFTVADGTGGGYVNQPEAWKWSSAKEYRGVEAGEQLRRCGLAVS